MRISLLLYLMRQLFVKNSETISETSLYKASHYYNSVLKLLRVGDDPKPTTYFYLYL